MPLATLAFRTGATPSITHCQITRYIIVAHEAILKTARPAQLSTCRIGEILPFWQVNSRKARKRRGFGVNRRTIPKKQPSPVCSFVLSAIQRPRPLV